MNSSFYEERRKDEEARRRQDRLDREAEAEWKRREKAEAEEQRRRERREAQREAERRKAARKAARATLRGKVMANLDTALALVAMSCSTGPAFYFQLVAMLGAGTPWLIAVALAVMLESGAWVATITGEKAKKEGRPTGMHRIAMWGCASIAAAINAAKAPALFPDASWMVAVLALSSYGGVAFWELRGIGRHKSGKSARTRAQRQAERARRKHARKRRTTFPQVWARYEALLAAHPLGTLDDESAWRDAWFDVHGADVAVTAEVLAHRIDADNKLRAVLEKAERTRESLALDRALAEILRTGGGEDGPAGGATAGADGGPRGGGSGASGGRAVRTTERPVKRLTTLGRKGKKASGRKAPKTPDRPLDPADVEKVRKLAEILGGPENLSARKVREAIGGGSQDYAVRLRNAVQGKNGAAS